MANIYANAWNEFRARVVDELPEKGESDMIYITRKEYKDNKEDKTPKWKYCHYVYIGDKYELIEEMPIEEEVNNDIRENLSRPFDESHEWQRCI